MLPNDKVYESRAQHKMDEIYCNQSKGSTEVAERECQE